MTRPRRAHCARRRTTGLRRSAGPLVVVLVVALVGTPPVTAASTEEARSVPEATSTTSPDATSTSSPDVVLNGEAVPVPSGPFDDAPSEAVPRDSVAVPPAVPVGDPQQRPDPDELALVMAARFEQERLGLMVALGLQAQAADALVASGADVASVGSQLSAARRRERTAADALAAQRRRVRQWAVETYMGATLRRAAYVLDSTELGDVPRRTTLASSAFGGLDEGVRGEQASLERLAARRRHLESTLVGAEERAAVTRSASEAAEADVARRRLAVAALDAGQAAVTAGVAFPVSGPNRFADTFGAPRMAGTPFAHPHQGVDVFAPAGTSVVAFERGEVARLGTDVLGGTKLWLIGATGTRYYYAHLGAYAPGLRNGEVVDVGQALGSVGNTGNARSTPAHLHFEIHPAADQVVNPFPLLAGIVAAAGPPDPRAGGPGLPPAQGDGR